MAVHVVNQCNNQGAQTDRVDLVIVRVKIREQSIALRLLNWPSLVHVVWPELNRLLKHARPLDPIEQVCLGSKHKHSQGGPTWIKEEGETHFGDALGLCYLLKIREATCQWLDGQLVPRALPATKLPPKQTHTHAHKRCSTLTTTNLTNCYSLGYS